MLFEIATRCVASSAGQDRVFARLFDDVMVVALADGAGGRAGGGEAAQIVIGQAESTFPSRQEARDASFWAQWLREVDDLICSDDLAGETTAIVAAIGADFVAGASVGDSSAWLVGDLSWRDLTDKQVRKPGLGFGVASPRPFSAHLKGQTLLFATDGLTKYADAERLVQITRGAQLQVVADALIAAVRYPSGNFPDDVSCILCRGPIRRG